MVIADTGFFVAITNPNDPDHRLASATLQKVKDRLITTWPVVTETTHMLMSRIGVAAVIDFVRSGAAGAFQMFDLTQAHLTRIEALMRRYRDLPMDLADASLVILAEEQDDGRILSTDRRDFRTYRWKNRKPFVNLLDHD